MAVAASAADAESMAYTTARGTTKCTRLVSSYEETQRSFQWSFHGRSLLIDYLNSLRMPVSPITTFATLLLEQKIIQHASITHTVKTLVDLYQQRATTSHAKYSIQLAVDCCLPYLTAIRYNLERSLASPVVMAPGWTGCVHAGSLPDFHLELCDSLYTKMAITDVPAHHVISKLFPRAGMPRKFAQILWKYIQQDSVFMGKISRILMCSLLGNYPFVEPQQHMDVGYRAFVYHMFSPDVVLSPRVFSGSVSVPHVTDAADTQQRNAMRRLFALLFSEPLVRLVLLAMREYAIYIIETSPVLLRHVQALFNYTNFRKHVLNGMRDVRSYLSANICFETREDDTEKEEEEGKKKKKKKKTMTVAEIMASVPWDPNSDPDTAREWQKELHVIVKQAYENTKRCAYRKDRACIFKQFRSVKGRFPPGTRWVPRHERHVYLRDPATADERCSATRRRSRIAKRKSASTTAAQEGDEEDAEGDEESKEEVVSVAAVPRRRNKRARVAEEELAPEDDDSLRPLAIVGSGESDLSDALHTETVTYVRRTMASDERKLEMEAQQAKEDDAEEKAIQEELGEQVTNVTDGIPWVVPRHRVGEVRDAVPLTRDRITMEHDALLRRFSEMLPREISDDKAFECICMLLPHLGASTSGIREIKRVAEMFSAGVLTGKEWDSNIMRIRASFPYTYNLVIASAGIWTQQCRVSLSQLPRDIHVAQLRAVAVRYNIPLPRSIDLAPEMLPEIPVALHYCKVCKRIYSIHRNRSRASVSRGTYTNGLQDVSACLITGQVFCHRPIVTGSASCLAQPLESIRVDGKIIEFGDQLYTICPQPNCGILSVIDHYSVSYNEHGIACSACTEKRKTLLHSLPAYIIRVLQNWIRPSGVAPRESIEAEMILPPLKCFVCGRDLKLNQDIEVWGRDTFICKRHYSGATARDMKRHIHYRMGCLGIENSVTDTDSDDTERTVRNLILEWKAMQSSVDNYRTRQRAFVQARALRAHAAARKGRSNR